MADVVPWDAVCSACGETHVVTARANHEPGELIRYAHTSGRKACGDYASHKLVAKLTGIETVDA